MPDPLHPSSSPSSKPEKQETVIDETESVNIAFKKENRAQNFFITSLILQDKKSSIKDEKEIIKPHLSISNKIQSDSTQNMLFTSNQIQSESTQNVKSKDRVNFKKPGFLAKLSCMKFRLPSLGGFFGSNKMSDKAVSRPMKYPYTFTAKLAQFPLKFYINNNWMWKYYLIAIGVSFPLFYKLSKASNTPENKKVWEEIRKRDFTPGGHH